VEFILGIFKSTIICEKQLGKLGYTKIKEETINHKQLELLLLLNCIYGDRHVNKNNKTIYNLYKVRTTYRSENLHIMVVLTNNKKETEAVFE